jgi:peptidoglycan hydrolase-like protein with peptidoglycan-binding domain
MRNRSWFGWSVLSFLAINLSQLPAVVSQPISVNRENVQTRILITINRPVLKLGSQGTDVSELQAALKLLGYFTGNVDGFYGESTASAVSSFQQASGLNADGIAGAATWNRLFPSVSAAETTPPRVSNNRQTAANKPVSGFPMPSSLQRTNSRDSRVIVPTTVEQVNRPNTTITPATSVSTVVNPQTTIISLPILKRGMRGPAIVQLQERLRSLGFFSSASDGVFGDVTQTAVKAVQQKFNIQPDGVVGAATWSILLR